jgi:hypothetical protein
MVGSFVVDGLLQFLHLVDGFEALDDVQVGDKHFLGDASLVGLTEGAGTV